MTENEHTMTKVAAWDQKREEIPWLLTFSYMADVLLEELEVVIRVASTISPLKRTPLGAGVHISHWASKFVLSTSSSLNLTELLPTQGLSEHKIQIEIEADDIPDGARNRKALWYLKILNFVWFQLPP